jgi:anti-sigma B factor antagonist
MEFSLSARVEDRESLVSVAGELDVATAGQLGDLLTEILRSGSSRVLLDLAGVTFMDCAALAVLLRAREASMVAGGGLCLLAVPRCVRLLLALTGTAVLAASPGAWCADRSAAAGVRAPAE